MSPGPAAGLGTGHDLINRLRALDVQIDQVKNNTPRPGSTPLQIALGQLSDAKEAAIKDLVTGKTAYGADLGTILLKLDCADRGLKRAELDKTKAVVGHLRDARDCLKAARKALAQGGQAPRQMLMELDDLIDRVDKTGDQAEAAKEDAEKLKGKELQKDTKRARIKKNKFILDWYGQGTGNADAAPMVFGILWFNLYFAIDNIDLQLIEAEFADEGKEIDKHLNKAIARKDALIEQLVAVNPTEGHFVTRARGTESTRICVYIKGPANQRGRVTLGGASISSTNPANFVLGDTGNDMVSFIVMGTGDYSVSIERQQPDGSFKGGETDSVTVPGPPPSPATAPPAGVGYGSQPCPAP